MWQLENELLQLLFLLSTELAVFDVTLLTKYTVYYLQVQ